MRCVRQRGIPISAGENVAGVFGFQSLIEAGGDRHRAAERHQDRRHRRDAAGDRTLSRRRCRGYAAQSVFRPWIHRDACISSRRCPIDPLVEVLWLDMEANPFHSFVVPTERTLQSAARAGPWLRSRSERSLMRYKIGETTRSTISEHRHESHARRNPLYHRHARQADRQRARSVAFLRLHPGFRSLRFRHHRRKFDLHAQRSAHTRAAVDGRGIGRSRRRPRCRPYRGFLGARLEGHQFPRPQGRARRRHLRARRRVMGCAREDVEIAALSHSRRRADRVPAYHSGGLWLSSSDKELVAEAERFAGCRLQGHEDAARLTRSGDRYRARAAVREAIGPRSN